IVLGLGLPLIAYGLIYTYWLAALGGLLVIAGAFGLGLEPSVDPDAGHDHHDQHDDHDGQAAGDEGHDQELAEVGATSGGDDDEEAS
ncbi:MAG: hypothetical protein M3N25_03480, partial [Actinomycetota bacterium]|nr:hypothetical protein [Actinomycetota bacterium]